MGEAAGATGGNGAAIDTQLLVVLHQGLHVAVDVVAVVGGVVVIVLVGCGLRILALVEHGAGHAQAQVLLCKAGYGQVREDVIVIGARHLVARAVQYPGLQHLGVQHVG